MSNKSLNSWVAEILQSNVGTESYKPLNGKKKQHTTKR